LALVIAWVTRRRLWMAALLLVVSLLGHGCGERRHSGNGPPPPAPENVTSLEGLPGEECGGPLMVWITRADDSRFCIDRFEAALDNGTLGDAHQGSDDQDMSLNGSTLAKATVALNIEPGTQVSWYQARAACENAGKRLCTLAEWELACRGPSAWIYPYGDAIDDSACNGFFRFPEEKPEQTGDLKSCASVWGAFDISGNVEEWVLDAVPRIPGMTELADRAVRGGSFKSNSNALACIGDEFHAAPGSADIDRGFRCCSDGPL
jgi:hypothetical protein